MPTAGRVIALNGRRIESALSEKKPTLPNRSAHSRGSRRAITAEGIAIASQTRSVATGAIHATSRLTPTTSRLTNQTNAHRNSNAAAASSAAAIAMVRISPARPRGFVDCWAVPSRASDMYV